MNWLLAIAAAALLVSVHPGLSLTWLSWIAVAPLVRIMDREPRWNRRFLFGWSAGVIYWFVHCYWIQFVLEFHGGMGFWGGWGSFLLFCFAKAIHMGVFATFGRWLLGRWWSPLAIAGLWAGLERTHGTFGFAWLALGNAGIDMPGLPRLAPVIGVYGISFVFVLAGGAIALRQWRWLAAAAALTIALSLVPVRHPAPTETAVVLQPNFDEEAQWTTASQDLMERQSTATSLERAIQSKAHLIIWPEAPAPIYYFDDPRFKEYATSLARTAQAYFLFGTVTYTPQGAPLNTAALVAPSGDFVDRYEKMYLVPFGEFIPPLFGFVNKITKEAGNYQPGTKIVTFPYGSQRLGTFICYESAFPHLVRRFAQAGAGAFVNISNDGYFGHSSARPQHLELVRMRALENHRWIVRATNDGITAVVDPEGRVTERLEPYKAVTSSIRFGFERGETVYTRMGDVFAWSGLAISVAVAAVRAARRKQTSQPA